MLGYFTNDTQVGLYVNSQKIVKIATTVTTSLATVTIPKVANSYSNGKIEEMRDTVYKSLTAVSFLAFPMCMGLMAIRKTLQLGIGGVVYMGMMCMLHDPILQYFMHGVLEKIKRK